MVESLIISPYEKWWTAALGNERWIGRVNEVTTGTHSGLMVHSAQCGPLFSSPLNIDDNAPWLWHMFAQCYTIAAARGLHTGLCHPPVLCSLQSASNQHPTGPDADNYSTPVNIIYEPKSLDFNKSVCFT